MSADQQGDRKQHHYDPAGARPDYSSIVDLGIRSHADALVDIVGDIGGRRIVDLGCGEGHFGRELAKRGALVIGVDPLIAPVVEQKFGTGSFQILQGSAEAVPQAGKSADLVTFIYSLHHMPEAALAKCLREATRLLRPAGRVYVAEPLAEGPLHYLTMPFHDETRVRANALSALRDLRFEFDVHDSFLYLERRVFADFTAFARRMTANKRFNDYDVNEVNKPSVVVRFNELFEQNGGSFDQPVLVNVFSRLRTRN
jgi:ubiquinone/menaquinone biosynthesis C-methylase UbiE